MAEGPAASTSRKTSVSSEYISAAANRASHSVDWAAFPQQAHDRDGFTVLAYGSHKAIAVAYNIGVSVCIQ